MEVYKTSTKKRCSLLIRIAFTLKLTLLSSTGEDTERILNGLINFDFFSCLSIEI